MDTGNILSKEEKRTKKALKYYKGRHLRNFFIWLFGVISFVLITVGGIAIVLGAIPMKNLVGEEQAGKAAEGSILEAVMNINNYTFADIPVAKDLVDSISNTEILEGKKISDFIRFKVDDIDSMKITEFTGKLTSNPGEMIEIVASINSVVGVEALGDFKNLEAFSTYKEVTGTIDVESESFVPALYYYKDGEEYKKAFDQDKNRLAPSSATIYYGALAYVPIPDALNLISERLGMEKVTSLISNLGGATFDEDSVLVKLIGETTVKDVGGLSLDDINLDVILPESNNADLYSILRGAAGLNPTDDVTIADLNGLDMEKVKLSGFLHPEDYEILYNLLTESTSKPANQITLKDLGEIDISKAKLSVLIGEKNSENQTLYNILEDVTGVAANNITINHLANFDLNGVKLTALFSIEENGLIYDILADTTGKTKTELTIEDLQKLDMNTMKLASVLDTTANAELFDFLSDNLPGNPAIDEISINDLAQFKMDNIKLQSVLPYNGNETTYKLLLSSITGKDKDTLAVKDLNDFNINDVKLADILGARTDKLYDILAQASGVADANDLTISSLTSSSFDISKVELSLVVADSGNMFKILKEATGKGASDTLKIADLNNFNINNISLSSILTNPEPHLKELITDACGLNSYDSVKVSHLMGESFNIDNVYMYHVMDADADLKELLENVYGVSYEEIKFAHIHNADGTTPFDVSKLKLSTIIKKDTGNASLDALRADDTVTIANLGDKLDALSLYEVYGSYIFTTNSSIAKDTSRKFVKTTVEGKDVYQQSASGNYYISNEAGVWLLLCCESQDKVNGTPTKYVESNLMVATLQQGSIISTILSSATIQELIDAGIMSNTITNPAILSMTIVEAIESIPGATN